MGYSVGDVSVVLKALAYSYKILQLCDKQSIASCPSGDERHEGAGGKGIPLEE
jgi:hypothetical protein